MIRPPSGREGFFWLLFRSFFDLNKSIRYQLRYRKLERHLLPLVYFVSFVLLIARLTDFASVRENYIYQEFQYARLSSLIVVHVFFLPLFLYILGVLIHWLLILFGTTATYFQTRLAFLWALTICSPIILVSSLAKVFILNSNGRFVLILVSELMVIYVLGVMLSIVSHFNNRKIVVISLMVIYFFLNIVVTSYI